MKAKRLLLLLLFRATLPMASAADPFPNTIPPAAQEPAMRQAAVPSVGACRATDLIGAKVTSRDGQAVGTLCDLVFDTQNGRVAFAIIKTLEDERKIAVPESSLKAKAGLGALTLECGQQHFRAASDFAKNDLLDPSWANATEAYYGVRKPTLEMAKGTIIAESAGAELPPTVANDRTTELAPAATAEASKTPIPSQPAVTLARSSDLVGTAIKDSSGHSAGEIKDILLDWKTGRMISVVLDTSEAADLGKRQIAVAPAAIGPSAGGGGFVVNLTKGELATAPSANY